MVSLAENTLVQWKNVLKHFQAFLCYNLSIWQYLGTGSIDWKNSILYVFLSLQVNWLSFVYFFPVCYRKYDRNNNNTFNQFLLSFKYSIRNKTVIIQLISSPHYVVIDFDNDFSTLLTECFLIWWAIILLIYTKFQRNKWYNTCHYTYHMILIENMHFFDAKQ